MGTCGDVWGRILRQRVAVDDKTAVVSTPTEPRGASCTPWPRSSSLGVPKLSRKPRAGRVHVGPHSDPKRSPELASRRVANRRAARRGQADDGHPMMCGSQGPRCDVEGESRGADHTERPYWPCSLKGRDVARGRAGPHRQAAPTTLQILRVDSKPVAILEDSRGQKGANPGFRRSPPEATGRYREARTLGLKRRGHSVGAASRSILGGRYSVATATRDRKEPLHEPRS